LRSPDRRERERNQHGAPHAAAHTDDKPATAPLAVIRATHVEPSAAAYAAADKPDRHTLHKPEKAEKRPASSDDEPANGAESRDSASADEPASRVVRAADADH
jgi:ribonuclease III